MLPVGWISHSQSHTTDWQDRVVKHLNCSETDYLKPAETLSGTCFSTLCFMSFSRRLCSKRSSKISSFLSYFGIFYQFLSDLATFRRWLHLKTHSRSFINSWSILLRNWVMRKLLCSFLFPPSKPILFFHLLQIPVILSLHLTLHLAFSLSELQTIITTFFSPKFLTVFASALSFCDINYAVNSFQSSSSFFHLPAWSSPSIQLSFFKP